ncbi:MAG: phosphoribosyltransferase [archaeon]|jgi:hypothetical protein
MKERTDDIDFFFNEHENIRGIYGSVRELMPAAERMMEYIHQNRFSYVVVGGSSAQIAAYMVKEAWKRKYAEPMPKFIAIGKLGTGHNQYAHGTNPSTYTSLLRKRFERQQNPFEKKVFVLDELIDEGTTMKLIQGALRKIGFRNVKGGVLVAPIEPTSKPLKGIDFVGVWGAGNYPGFKGAERVAMKQILAYRRFRKQHKELKELLDFLNIEAKKKRNLRSEERRTKLSNWTSSVGVQTNRAERRLKTNYERAQEGLSGLRKIRKIARRGH